MLIRVQIQAEQSNEQKCWQVMSNYGKSNRKCHQNAQKGRPRAPKAHQKGTKLMAKHAKISQNGAMEQKYGF